MNIKTILAVLAGLVLAACAEDVIENNIVMKTRHSLTVEVMDEFAATTRADYSGFPSTSFETGDAIGIYAFDGSSYVASNIRFVRQSDGSWLPDGRGFVCGWLYVLCLLPVPCNDLHALNIRNGGCCRHEVR